MLEIREERTLDYPEVDELVEAAFGRPAEAELVSVLREDPIRIASLVAVESELIVGHAMFSCVWIDGDAGSTPIASLAPMAVRPDRQRRGVGSALVARGIEACRAHGWSAIVVVGHAAYYPRFGFSASTVAHLDSPYAGEHFMGLELRAGALAGARGRIRYPAVFDQLK